MPETWHDISIDDAMQKLESSPAGLNEEEARRRLEKYGPNELAKTRRISPVMMFLRQFYNMLIIILIIAAVIAGLLGEWIDATVILIIVVLNSVLGFVQEYRAERALEALKVLAAPQCRVIRQNETREIQTRELVPGDIILLSAGDKVPADMRLIETANLRVDEAPLTGESVSVSKRTERLAKDIFLGDRKNMCYLGCTIEAGRGSGIVTSTGMATELGKIAGLVQAEPEPKTPMQVQLARLGKQIGVAIIALVALIFVIEYIRIQADIIELFLTSVSLAVAAIPEGLPAVVTISLALGLQRMARRHALIRRLPSVEALGSATVICTDKTGTLTRGEMNTVTIFTGGRDYRVHGEGFNPDGKITLDNREVDLGSTKELDILLKAGMLCSDATVHQMDGAWTVTGDTTEGALIVAGMRAGLSKEGIGKEMPRAAEIAFTSERKMMTTVHVKASQDLMDGLKHASEEERLRLLASAPYKMVLVKGAPERIMKVCTRIAKDGGVEPLTADDSHQLAYKNQEMAARGLRVLGLAYRELPENWDGPIDETLEKDLVFLGFAGMMDTPRGDAITALRDCQKAGIKVVMITGDHKLTAMAVAADMGILTKGQKALTGDDLNRLSDEDLHKIVKDVRVYARVSPEDKLRILNAWRKKGDIVVMTGDGVNDAPALKSSNLGVAMGITGTDVAKESADMILTDDNFASIVGAVEEGRSIHQNIRKFVRYLLSTNSGEVLTIFVAALILLPLPLIPLQILWINLITDGLPAVALSAEPKEKGLMALRPKDPKKGILTRGIIFHIIWVGVYMMVGTLLIFVWSLGFRSLDEARTLVFFTLTMFQVFHVLAIRVERNSVFKAGFFGNKYMILAVLSTVFLQLLVIYAPMFQGVFQTVSLPWEELLLATALTCTLFFLVEFEKLVQRRTRAGKEEA